MKTRILTFALTVGLLPGTALAQGQHHGGGRHNLWPDSLTTVEVTGTVIVDENFFHPLYYLDEDGDGQADYHLSFGPWWYAPANGLTRPQAGETVTILGELQEHMQPPTLVVFKINGETWREPVAYGMHGWNGDPAWGTSGDTLTITGTVLVDTTYFYAHFFLDTNQDSVPEYVLGFGPPWYEPASGATRPQDGEVVTIFGRVHEMPGPDRLSVYAINGLEWRPLDQPAPWAGTWMHRSHGDTTYVYCVNDSANWVGFAPGHMGHGMGGMMWPDSVFVQFWEVHPDSLPGTHDDQRVRGFYLDVHEPNGMSMMDGRFGGWHGRMRFERDHVFQFHYDEDELRNRGYTEDGISMKYWDADAGQWQTVSGVRVDQEANTVSFASTDLSNYYVLTAPEAVTGVAENGPGAQPTGFVLLQNYPNPFNPSTTIRFELPVQAEVLLAVYNLLGQRIAVLVNENRPAGVYTVQWNGTDDTGQAVSSGVYLLRLEAGDQVRLARMTLLK